MEKFTADVINAVNHFKGLQKIKIAYADKAPEFEVAMKKLKIPFDHSLPHHPQNNSLAERNNHCVMTTTTTCLLEAGLPPCFWNHAVECVSHLLNIEGGEDEKGSNFTERNSMAKRHHVVQRFSSRQAVEEEYCRKIPGVFAGYEVKPGMNWSRQYRVWSLETFATQSLAFDARRPIRKLNKPQLTETVVFMSPIEFPLKAEYERINNTFEGMKIRELRDGELEIGDPRKEIEYDEDEYLPSEPRAFDHEELAERAIDDEPDDDQPLDFGEDDDDDPKPDDDSKKTPVAPPKATGPPVVVRDERVPIGSRTICQRVPQGMESYTSMILEKP